MIRADTLVSGGWPPGARWTDAGLRSSETFFISVQRIEAPVRHSTNKH